VVILFTLNDDFLMYMQEPAEKRCKVVEITVASNSNTGETPDDYIRILI
jgi:hypothetical protein